MNDLCVCLEIIAHESHEILEMGHKIQIIERGNDVKERCLSVE